ncbi:ABC transporter ATP-binding protein [Nocardiopsis dassonvillei]|jgi:branched-chain amino acid transport system ATP-binding protein|uniref:ABC transporter related protein n=1 Tax=Nocardiopsis dassonvillei (strain ATCC 23218 / DSM 43111 / CIP 107115 / JCM 7437 / KCTC 9190 / NBRC 14626 / NCTC 10488 / NRRL B-5397 / IMRU 509) TaxID=446468 RepID=D7AZ00_NOCDD|nr:ABC transporter ATP-binding protein [Nocardiopsis dassonvillei]ADH69980.1 ABC transporter related protein [Nocardiopsis dassonvillei subsp. dassonvillei DSM 43111]APC37967.1 ABC transporter ATP-binding protein [Nocardiopsis dassonvillei]NKY77528.1 ABC transporter ATP-binding protein [Nocardiopsis dassonvillei]VEI90493.1 LIV-I protein F [Nocardiopsis dassonvillei]
MTAPPLLTVEELSASYGAVRALDRVSLTVPAKGVCAVLGANGAGKTTLLRTLTGLHPAASGRVLLDGEDITRLPAEKVITRGLAHVPEGGGVIVELTVEENLRLGGLWRSDRRRDSAMGEVLELFPPLAERRARPASTLSGGERQMLAIGRALMARPRVLLLDEPSLGLAPLVTRQIFTLLRDLRDRTGLTVVLVEQNAAGALSVTETGFVLNQGRVAVGGASADLLSDDRTRHAYLGF